MSLLQRRRWGISWWPESGAHRVGKDTNSWSEAAGYSWSARISDGLRLLSGIETFCRFSHLGLVGNYVPEDNPLLEQVRPCALKGGRAYKNKHGW